MSMPKSRFAGVCKFTVAAAWLIAGAVILAGCSSSSVGDHMPTAAGGLPDGAPQRQARPHAYPAVHDMPPARDSTVLSDEEQTRLEADLAKARERLAGQTSSTDKPAASGRKP
jgi:hypothetical protein